ncbi:MAG: hypothetical protein COZ24_10815, partial [Hydrogenophilales bacterium CG_4_10_14_3_um_filter_63_21]
VPFRLIPRWKYALPFRLIPCWKRLTLPHPDHVEIILEDTGPGIPAEWRYKVFEPFFTTKGAERGHLGMGLSMAQDTVARHGGLIDVDPDIRDGCRVRVQLPARRTGSAT